MRRLIFTSLLFLLIGVATSFSQKIDKEDYFKRNLSLGGEVIIKKSIVEAKGLNTKTSFEIQVPTAGEYNIHFWMFPTMLKNGSYAQYAVEVNGEIQNNRIMPTSGDWHSATIANGDKVRLKSGINTVAVIGCSPDVPNVEHIRLSKGDASIDGSKYREYRAEMEKANLAAKAQRKAAIAGDTISIGDLITPAPLEDPLYNFALALNVKFRYTFYKTVYFTKGKQIFLSSTGIDNFAHVLELFSVSNPDINSWSARSNSNCQAYINITIPETGMYYVRVRSYLNGSAGFCNLNVNGENYYTRVPLYSFGVRCTQDTDNEYNTFTAYSTGNPMLWIEEYDKFPGKISAYNDDYVGTQDFYWDLDARIKKTYSRPVHAALLSASSSYSPTGQCDLYVKCLNSIISTKKTIVDGKEVVAFPYLEPDDEIQSSPNSFMYNCISWTGGITSYNEWPLYTGSEYYDEDPLTAFDNFYASKGYTREGATLKNATVALWAKIKEQGKREYTHGSIRKGDRNAHGYAWESKPGKLMRTFHPINGVYGPAYGKIVEYYKPVFTSLEKMLAEEIADGNSVIEYVDFNAEESALINDRILSISPDINREFCDLYKKWTDATAQTPFSNPDQIADCEEYRKVYEFCKTHPECKYILYDRLSEREIEAIILIENLALKTMEGRTIMAEIREGIREEAKMKANYGIRIVRPMSSNYIAFVKELLADELSKLKKQASGTTGIDGVSYSNSHKFTAEQNSGGITVDFQLVKECEVILSMMDLTGNTVCVPLNGCRLDKGRHIYSLNAPCPGVYLIELIIDGKVNVKKVIVK